MSVVASVFVDLVGVYFNRGCKAYSEVIYGASFGLLVFLISFRGVIGFLRQLWELHMCQMF